MYLLETYLVCGSLVESNLELLYNMLFFLTAKKSIYISYNCLLNILNRTSSAIVAYVFPLFWLSDKQTCSLLKTCQLPCKANLLACYIIHWKSTTFELVPDRASKPGPQWHCPRRSIQPCGSGAGPTEVSTLPAQRWTIVALWVTGTTGRCREPCYVSSITMQQYWTVLNIFCICELILLTITESPLGSSKLTIEIKIYIEIPKWWSF